jgi:hypothetical protein
LSRGPVLSVSYPNGPAVEGFRPLLPRRLIVLRPSFSKKSKTRDIPMQEAVRPGPPNPEGTSRFLPAQSRKVGYLATEKPLLFLTLAIARRNVTRSKGKKADCK